MSSALDRLRSATHFQRSVADADRVALVGPAATIDGYIEYLRRTYGFEVPLESALSASPLPAAIDLPKRLKAGRLSEQLRALGVPAAELLNIPHAPLAPLRSVTKAFAWLFVSETNRSSHELFWRYIARQLPVLEKTSVAPPERTTRAQWNVLGNALEELAADGACVDEVVTEALHAFDLQHRWFQPMKPPASVLSAANKRAEELLHGRSESSPGPQRKPDSDSE